MATSTIKPAGGGDYTTLAAWEDWADGQPGPLEEAECYAGGDLGEVTLENWTPTPRIYVAAGEGHDGTKGSAGAYIDASAATGIYVHTVDGTQIEGLRIVSTGQTAIRFFQCGGKALANLIEHTPSANYQHAIWFHDYGGQNTTIDAYAQRNLVYGDESSFRTAGIAAVLYENAAGEHSTYDVYFDCNTIHGMSEIAHGQATGILFMLETGDATATAEIDFKSLQDNVATMAAGSSASCFSKYSVGVGTATFTESGTIGNNLSSDGTAESAFTGESNCLVNKSASTQFTAPLTDLNLLSGADAKDAGVAIGGIATDAIGNAYATPPSMGALEYMTTAMGSLGGQARLPGMLRSKRSRTRGGLGG